MNRYTGIGSRDLPNDIRLFMEELGKFLSKKNYVLRSGGADGADLACELNAEHKEIFLPWKGFNNNPSELYLKSFSKEINQKSAELARRFHPVYDQLSYGAQCMMKRNMHQVLGIDLETPSDFVVCWTKNGKDVGGTGTAIRCAWAHSVPVYNLYNETDTKSFRTLMNMVKNDVAF